MDGNMQEKLEEFLKGNPEEITAKDENGLTLLHRDRLLAISIQRNFY